MDNVGRETERIFVAVKLPESIGEGLAQQCAESANGGMFAKWTHFHDYHLTLQFLGDTALDKLPALTKSLRSIAAKSEPFTLRLDHWGVFGPSNAPRVLWTGVSGELDMLRQLQQNVVAATVPLGFTAEARAYNPHITLARKYRGEESFDGRKLHHLEHWLQKKENNCSEKDWTVDAFVLYATRMHAIPMYESIERVSLE